MRYVVSLVISIVVWKLVVGPAIYEAVKALETATHALRGLGPGGVRSAR
jgi:hypothetical protein